jgi:hypothetical protein
VSEGSDLSDYFRRGRINDAIHTTTTQLFVLLAKNWPQENTKNSKKGLWASAFFAFFRGYSKLFWTKKIRASSRRLLWDSGGGRIPRPLWLRRKPR